ncbi:alpha/beta-hydrolase [Xylariales sp. AK1849]|nr:alpha/beta-hydrolase [Xylariales sp. AK1849]
MSIDTTDQVPAALALLPQFHICNAFYKAIGYQPIGVHILIPKGSPSGKRPLLVRIHGGGFSEGKSDSFLRTWILELALKHKALLVTPDYRLMPEGDLSDIIEDMRDFWQWVETALPKMPGIEVDVNNLAIVGESAGGYLTAQTALLGMKKHVRVLMIQYPLLDIEGHLKWLEGSPESQKVPVSFLDEHIARSIPEHLVTRIPYGWRVKLIYSIMQNGRLANVSKDTYLDPMKSLDSAGAMPPVFLFHGTGDTSVRWEGSRDWADKLKRLHPDTPLHLVFREGEHCFDQEDTLETPWLKDPIEFVERFWPAP